MYRRNGRGADDCVGDGDYLGLAVGVDWDIGGDGSVGVDGDSGMVGVAGGNYRISCRIDDPQIAYHVLSICDYHVPLVTCDNVASVCCFLGRMEER